MSPPVAAATADQAAVPEQAAEDAPLLEHAYDGIREYDNPLPGWWRAMFWGSIVFAAGYFIWFHVADRGESPDARYRAELAVYQSKRAEREAADAANVSEDVLARNSHDDKLVAHGAEIFATRCASCHTADGRGLIGPNLTDLFQIHGSTRMDMFTTIKNGVSGTAMPAWGEQMAPADVVAVATFATTLRGKNVAGGKAPQGAAVEAFK
jgi:cytochrome c oxidase cbb3-type subunit III